MRYIKGLLTVLILLPILATFWIVPFILWVCCLISKKALIKAIMLSCLFLKICRYIIMNETIDTAALKEKAERIINSN